MKSCGQTNIPETDNSQIECEEFYSTNCIIYPEPILPFGVLTNSSLTVVIKALVKRIRQNLTSNTQLKSRVQELENQLTEVDQKLIDLQDQINNINP